jgi:hypothetical protein
MQSENYKRLQSRLKNAAAAAAARTDGSRNPMLAFASPPSTPGTPGMPGTPGANSAHSDLDRSAQSIASDRPKESFELETTASAPRTAARFQRAMPMLFLAAQAALQYVCTVPKLSEVSTTFFRSRVLLHRAYCALRGRFELILGSLILHILLGLLFAWVNETITPASVIAYLGIGTLFLILANAQFVFFIFTNHHVRQTLLLVVMCVSPLSCRPQAEGTVVTSLRRVTFGR